MQERRKGSGNEEALRERRESDLREEISHLRDARDSLMVRRQKLNRRIHKVNADFSLNLLILLLLW